MRYVARSCSRRINSGRAPRPPHSRSAPRSVSSQARAALRTPASSARHRSSGKHFKQSVLQMARSASLQAFVCVCAMSCARGAAGADELPLCPTNVNYLPQSLPMHCRMPRNAVYPVFPGVLPNLTFPPLPPIFQNPSPDKQPPSLPIGMAPGPPRPAQMPVAMPMMPAAMPGPAHKLPVIVMPFYSPDGPRKLAPRNAGHRGQKKRRVHINKKRKPRYHSDTDMDSETDTSDADDSRDVSSETSSADSAAGWWAGRRSGRRPNAKHAHKRKKYRSNKEPLTPVLQYVTKDGYVIYEKKISKNQAKEWMQDKREADSAREFNEPPKGEHNQKQEEDEAEDVINDNETDTQKRDGAGAGGGGARVKLRKNPHRRKPKTASKKAEAR